MIQTKTLVKIADNTGGKTAVCIGVLSKGRAKNAMIGDLVSLVVRDISPRGQVKKGETAKGVVVRTVKPIRRPDGTWVRFDENAVVLVSADLQPRGTRVFGPVARDLRDKGFLKIISLAPEIV